MSANPDFSMDSKRRIAKVVRRVEGMPADYTNVTRPFRLMGGTLPSGEFDGMLFGNVSDNATGFSFRRIINLPPGF